MHHISLIFPHQLFKKNPVLHPDRTVILIEEFLFFRHYRFHQQKIMLHRAGMQYYAALLQKKKYKVRYIESTESEADIRTLLPQLARQGITEIHYTDSIDNWLEKRLNERAAQTGIRLVKYTSPNFLNRLEDVESFFEKKKTYFQTDFYTWQRKQRRLLLEPNNQPLGGKWTFDTDNRKKFPKQQKVPLLRLPAENQYVKEARSYVKKYYSHHYGSAETFIYPVTHADAEKWLHEFLQTRFQSFGMYEDAMLKNESFLFHSVLTPMLNTGLLDPQQIIDKALDAASQYEIPLNSLEGFVRQITGWREFIRIVYEKEGSRQRSTNYWGFNRKLPTSFWTGETGIHPVDTVIKRVLKCGYAHHIERLMVLGNFMLLCEFDPDDVYRWFMEMFVDSYDWVMVPNVYGMTQFADGGLMTTKPYISGSNYLMKMGDWEKGPWQQIWDGLFWRFMHVHRQFFLTNPRLGMLVKTFDKMDAGKKKAHWQHAEKFLTLLDP